MKFKIDRRVAVRQLKKFDRNEICVVVSSQQL